MQAPMTNLAAILLALFLTVLPQQVFADDIRVATYLRNLADEHQFELQGEQLVQNETFSPRQNTKKIERSIANALRNFNHIVKYDQQGQIRLVQIVGRKSNDVGPLSDPVAIEATPIE